MQEHQLINQDSGCVEWFTPPEIIEAARATLGEIDLDPFSCWQANQIVGATEYYTKENDGWNQWWSKPKKNHLLHGRKIWCNHPFSRENNARIANKVISEYKQGSEIVMITFAATSEKWFQPLLQFPQCFLTGRTNYLDINGNKVKGVTKGSVVTYLGEDISSFADSFRELGVIKVCY